MRQQERVGSESKQNGYGYLVSQPGLQKRTSKPWVKKNKWSGYKILFQYYRYFKKKLDIDLVKAFLIG